MEDINLGQHFLKKLGELYKNSNLCDVTLKATPGGAETDNDGILLHSVVMAAHSPAFRTLFIKEIPGKSRWFLYVRRQNLKHWRTLVNFMYSGNIAINNDNVDAVTNLAKLYKINRAAVLCDRFKTSNRDLSRISSLNSSKQQHVNLQEIFQIEKSSTVAEMSFIKPEASTPKERQPERRCDFDVDMFYVDNCNTGSVSLHGSLSQPSHVEHGGSSNTTTPVENGGKSHEAETESVTNKEHESESDKNAGAQCEVGEGSSTSLLRIHSVESCVSFPKDDPPQAVAAEPQNLDNSISACRSLSPSLLDDSALDDVSFKIEINEEDMLDSDFADGGMNAVPGKEASIMSAPQTQNNSSMISDNFIVRTDMGRGRMYNGLQLTDVTEMRGRRAEYRQVCKRFRQLQHRRQLARQGCVSNRWNELLDDPQHIQMAVRQTYKELLRSKDFTGWNFNFSMTSDVNQAVHDKLLGEVQENFGREKWGRLAILKACNKHWRSKRDMTHMQKAGKAELHKKRNRRNGLIRHKQRERLAAIDSTSWDPAEKLRVEKLFGDSRDFISSEESDSETEYSGIGPKPRKVNSLRWETDKVLEYKKILDDLHLAHCSLRQRQGMSDVRRKPGHFSERPPPPAAPEWAVNTDYL